MMEGTSLGRLIGVYGLSPTHQQRAAVLSGLSFLFFLAMLLAFYVRAQFGYFLLSTAFLIVFAFTMIGWWWQRRNIIEIFDRGIRFRGRQLLWDEVAAIRDRPEGFIIETKSRANISIPKTIEQFHDVRALVETRTGNSG